MKLRDIGLWLWSHLGLHLNPSPALPLTSFLASCKLPNLSVPHFPYL